MKVKSIYISILIGLDFILLAALLSFLANDSEYFIVIPELPGSFLIFLGLSLIIAAIVLLLINKFNPSLFKEIKSIFFEEVEFDGDKYIEDLRIKIMNSYNKNNNVEDRQIDILELMLDNMKEIRDYYVISKKQAKNSFSLAVALCITGFIFILCSIILITVFNISSAVAIIVAIGGVISEMVAATALVVYRTSLEQLNNYYESLHNNERFLSLVNLVNKISDKKQDDVYTNIINIELQNYRSQNNK